MYGIGFLAATGATMIVSGALRLPSWARLRSRQMEALASELGSDHPKPVDQADPRLIP